MSGDGSHFGFSMDPGGIFAMSRILSDREVLVVCTPNPFTGWNGWVEVDAEANPPGSNWQVAFSTLANGGNATTTTFSTQPPRRAIQVSLQSNELLVLERI